jgi:hypothetical protein
MAGVMLTRIAIELAPEVMITPGGGMSHRLRVRIETNKGRRDWMQIFADDDDFRSRFERCFSYAAELMQQELRELDSAT